MKFRLKPGVTARQVASLFAQMSERIDRRYAEDRRARISYAEVAAWLRTELRKIAKLED